MWGKKQFGNNWEVEKRNTSVERVEPDPFLEKMDKKTVALTKTISTKKMSLTKVIFGTGFYKIFIGDF